ncbi:Glycogen synthase [Gossypium arboreum]|uniref:Glycogen synthase n=1 Tax=Gossypium arboreum TaxID=29729 RepID=A0A0B0P0Z2_GOSAR|nr:Glycogen synthase [Gossypium arboreum]
MFFNSLWDMKCAWFYACWMPQKWWQIGFSNGLFLSTRVETRACVSTVCNTQSCYMVVCPLG